MPEMPEWVQVWSWLRFLHDPREMTALPQQGDVPEAMSQERYSELRSEWIEAERPALTVARIVVAMSGGAVVSPPDPLHEDPGF